MDGMHACMLRKAPVACSVHITIVLYVGISNLLCPNRVLYHMRTLGVP